jgi:hypothetical protein
MTASQGPRRGPKRPRRKPSLDPEVLHLAHALTLNPDHDSPEGWLRLPWQLGWNAIELAREIAHLTDRYAPFRDPLATLCVERVSTPSVYEEAERLAQLAYGTHPAYYVALRCLQMQVANSDGGGRVYNAWLLPVCLRLTNEELGEASRAVMTWRCHDAIGVGPSLRGDALDEMRRAFRTAWTRGLYKTAYALPRKP